MGSLAFVFSKKLKPYPVTKRSVYICLISPFGYLIFNKVLSSLASINLKIILLLKGSN